VDQKVLKSYYVETSNDMETSDALHTYDRRL